MKTKIAIFFLIVFGLLAFYSCNDDDDNYPSDLQGTTWVCEFKNLVVDEDHLFDMTETLVFFGSNLYTHRADVIRTHKTTGEVEEFQHYFNGSFRYEQTGKGSFASFRDGGPTDFRVRGNKLLTDVTLGGQRFIFTERKQPL